MGLKDKLFKKKQELLDEIQKGKEISEQKRAEKLRSKYQRIVNLKPGAKKTLLEGLSMGKSIKQVMNEEYHRRKDIREKKYDKH